MNEVITQPLRYLDRVAVISGFYEYQTGKVIRKSQGGVYINSGYLSNGPVPLPSYFSYDTYTVRLDVDGSEIDFSSSELEKR